MANKHYIDSADLIPQGSNFKLGSGANRFSDLYVKDGINISPDLVYSGLLVPLQGSPGLTADRTWELPDASGTIALLSDVQASDTLAEILANDNNTGANNIIVQAGQAITANLINETSADTGVSIEQITLENKGAYSDIIGVGGSAMIEFNRYVKDDIAITTDSGAFSLGGALYIANSEASIYWDGSKIISVSSDFAIVSNSVATTDQALVITSVALTFMPKSALSSLNTNGITIGNNSISTISSPNANGLAMMINSRNSTANSGITNSVILGGSVMIAKTNNTAYVQNLGFYESGTIEGLLSNDTLTADRAWTLPDATGTIALLSDITANDELSEILANGNTTGATDLIVTVGQKITTDTIDETGVGTGITIDSVLIKDGGITLLTGGAVNAILDEDNMASNSATALVTQQSIKEYVDTSVGFNFDYFFNDTADAIGGIYYEMEDDSLGGGESTLTTVIGATGSDKPLVNFISPIGSPGVEQIEAGVYDIHIHAEKTAGSSTVDGIYWELYKRKADTTETLLGTSEISGAITAKEEFNLHLVLSSTITLVSTDRLLIKFYANLNGGAGATVALYQEGNTVSHFTFQVTSSILSNVFLRQDDNLSSLLNAGTSRTNLGVAIGSDVLAYDDGLSNLAGIAMAADKFYYTSADNVHVAGDITAAGRAILDDADTTAQRTTLGLGTSDSPVFTKVIEDGTTISTGPGAILVTGAIHEITTTGNDALSLIDGTEGQVLKIVYVAEGAGTDIAILTPDSLAGDDTTITFTDLGDGITLLFTASAWYVTGMKDTVVIN